MELRRLICGNLIKFQKKMENTTKSDSNFAPAFVNHHVLPDINFDGHCLINSISIPEKVINLYISYILNPWLANLNTDLRFNDCLFGSVKLTKDADADKYKYSDYGIGFNSRIKQMEAWEKMSLFLELI